MRRGITILRSELSAARDEGHATDTDTDSGAEVGKEAFQEALCSALCSLAELLMGMAAETADEAEDAVAAAAPALEEAEILLQEARELWRSSPEPLQALASLRRVQGRDEDALALLRQSMALWYREDAQGNEVEGEENGAAVAGDRKHGDVVGFGDHRATPGTNGDALDVDIDGEHEESSTLPSYEFRFETAKLLLELDDTTDAAIDVLEGLLEENDVVPDVWLLLAVAHRAGGEAEAAAEAAAEGASVAQRLGLPPGHEVAAALEEIKGELAGLSLSGLGLGGIGDKGNER
jgi:tetratricopeptide (TPR) repeat protein